MMVTNIPTISTGITASRTGEVETLRAWLQKGGNPNTYDTNGWTPLLVAAARGQAEVVDLLVNNDLEEADLTLPQKDSRGLPIHYAGQSGNVRVAELLLDKRSGQLDEVWLLNGHTLFLQAVFFDHYNLADFCLRRGANTAATTVRGLGGMELARQFDNERMMNLIRPYDSTKEKKSSYYRDLLHRIAPIHDRVVQRIEQALAVVTQDPKEIDTALSEIRDLFEKHEADPNQLGGALQQPPLIAAVTGNNGIPRSENVSILRKQLVQYLLERGADPLVCERHPMAVNAIIRAAVFNHLELLEIMASRMTSESLAGALNGQPVVNGLTALHDTVLRASTAAAEQFDGYLRQIRWCVKHGARMNIEDFAGRTQLNIAESVQDPVRQALIMEALKS